MLTSFLTPAMLAQVQAGASIVLLLIVFVGFLLFTRRLNGLQQTITAQGTKQDERQKAMQELIEKNHKSSEDQIRDLRLAQVSTTETVSTTRQNMQDLAQDLTTLQRDAQNLMRELKTQHSSTQAFMAEWKKDTDQLSRALRNNYQQGIWGEHELERVVELAGMQRHCDFEIKKTLPNGQTPDMLIHLPNHRTIVIDSKAPSQVYTNAMNIEDDALRAEKLKEYAHRVKDMMYQLAKKEYWKPFQPGLALVILFIPNEAMFRAALQQDLNLLELAHEKKILLASPVTLIALLKALAYGWSQEDRAQHVQQIVDRSKELHKELETWLPQWQSLRAAINKTSIEFNRVAKRYETHILPLLQALGALDSTLVIKDKTFELQPLPPETRPWSAALESEQEPATVIEPLPAPSSQVEQEATEMSWQGRFTQPLKKLQALLPPDLFSQEKENGS